MKFIQRELSLMIQKKVTKLLLALFAVGFCFSAQAAGIEQVAMAKSSGNNGQGMYGNRNSNGCKNCGEGCKSCKSSCPTCPSKKKEPCPCPPNCEESCPQCSSDCKGCPSNGNMKQRKGAAKSVKSGY